MVSQSEKTRQLVIIGGGPGGYPAAFRAKELGLDVTLIDDRAAPGGVCLHCGCIPSKALLHAAEFVHDLGRCKRWGVSIEGFSIDSGKLNEFKEGVVERLTKGVAQLCKKRDVEYIQGTASFKDASTLKVKPKKGKAYTLPFEQAIIATGSEPMHLPGGDDMPDVVTSKEALDVSKVPERLLVVGAGYIGIELGQVYAALGAQVTVAEMLPRVLPDSDPELVEVLQKTLKRQFKKIHLETKVADIQEEDEGLRVSFEGAHEETETFDRVLVAIGRRPLTRGLNLENTRVELDDKGFIQVDAQRRTAEPALFAIGDVAGEPMLAHKATHEGRVAAEAAAGQNSRFEPRAIPMVIFSNPEIAYCGLSENVADAHEVDVVVRKFPWAASGRAVTLDRTDGLTKLVIERDTGRIVGVGIVGVNAGELIAQGVHAIEMGAVAEDVALMIHTHPTLSETLMEAAEAFHGQSTHY